MTDRPIHVIVVAYHGEDDLARCIASLGGSVSVIVIDNSSSEAVRAVVVRAGVEYLDAGKNLGFAAGANLALRRLIDEPPRDVLLLNPDAVLTPHDLRALVGCLHQPGNERIAAASPRLVGSDGNEQRVQWPFPTPGRAWAEALGVGKMPAGRTYVIGAVLMIRWEALLEVGLFDERFFLYAEETDWQRRAVALGWRSAVCPDAVAEHRGAGTSENHLRRELLFHAAHETYIRKWHGRPGWWLYRSAAVSGATARALALRGERRAEAARRARIYIRGPRRCAAPARE